MKLSKTTIDVLRNFAQINPAINIENGGNEIVIASASNDMCAHVKIEETFPQTFCIYDINDFLNTLSVVEEPTLVFDPQNDSSFKIQSGVPGNDISINYRFSDPSFIATHTKPKPFDADFTIDIPHDIIAQIVKASSVMRLTHVVIKSDSTGVYIELCDKKNSGANTYRKKISEPAGFVDAEYVIRTDLFKFLPYDYSVRINEKGIAEFKCDDKNTTYWVALQV